MMRVSILSRMNLNHTASYNIFVIVFQENHIKNLLSHKPYEIIGLVQIEVVVHHLEALSSYQGITPLLYGLMRTSWIAFHRCISKHLIIFYKSSSIEGLFTILQNPQLFIFQSSC